MIDIEVTRRFGAAPEDVFRAYVDDSGWERRGADPRDRVGAVRVVGAPGMQLHEQLLEVEPPRRLAYQVVRGATGFRKHWGEVLFEPAGDGTLLRWRVRLEPVVPGTGWLLEAATKTLFQRSLEALARRRFPA